MATKKATKRSTKSSTPLPPAWVIVKALGACSLPDWMTERMSAKTAFSESSEHGDDGWIIDALNMRANETERVEREITEVAEKLSRAFPDNMDSGDAEDIVRNYSDAFGIEEDRDEWPWEEVETAIRQWARKHQRIIRSAKERGFRRNDD